MDSVIGKWAYDLHRLFRDCLMDSMIGNWLASFVFLLFNGICDWEWACIIYLRTV